MMKHFFKSLANIALCVVVGGAAGAIDSTSLRIQFIKGNIADKTAAVREADGEWAPVLARTALSFVLEHKAVLGDDRDLAGLAVASVLAVPDSYSASLPAAEQMNLSQELTRVFELFSDATVKIAVVSKAVYLSDRLHHEVLVSAFNDYISRPANESDSAVVKETIQALGTIGNDESFSVLYRLYLENTFPSLTDECARAIARLAPRASDYVDAVIAAGDVRTIRPLFDVIEKSADCPDVFKARIAEMTLSTTIYTAEGNQPEAVLNLQLDALRVLVRLNWTRAAETVIVFFDQGSTAYTAGRFSESDFVEVIAATAALSPLDASRKLSAYLVALNAAQETGRAPAPRVVRAVISALGAIGNKQAFDALLAVTYLTYPDDIIAGARDSLARLKW